VNAAKIHPGKRQSRLKELSWARSRRPGASPHRFRARRNFLFFPRVPFMLPRSGWGLVFLTKIKKKMHPENDIGVTTIKQNQMGRQIKTFTDGRRAHT
jgi:hypothetical protein